MIVPEPGQTLHDGVRMPPAATAVPHDAGRTLLSGLWSQAWLVAPLSVCPAMTAPWKAPLCLRRRAGVGAAECHRRSAVGLASIGAVQVLTVVGVPGLGAVVGGVVPRVAYRLAVPTGTAAREGCHVCDVQFAAGWAGWHVLGGRCRSCGGRLGPPGWAYTVAVAAACAALAVRLPSHRPIDLALLITWLFMGSGWCAARRYRRSVSAASYAIGRLDGRHGRWGARGHCRFHRAHGVAGQRCAGRRPCRSGVSAGGVGAPGSPRAG